MHCPAKVDLFPRFSSLCFVSCFVYIFCFNTVEDYYAPPAGDAPAGEGEAGGGAGDCEACGGNNGYMGDGYCDDENNIACCEYDKGDCCMNPVNTAYCSVCACLP